MTSNPYVYVAAALLLVTHGIHLRRSLSGWWLAFRLPGAWSVFLWLLVYLTFGVLLLSSQHGTDPVRGSACVALLIVAGAIRVSAARVLGEQYTEFISVPDGHQVVTEGIYRVMVHPLHFGLLLEHLALWLMSSPGSYVRFGTLTMLLVASYAVCLTRNRQEEDSLRKRHGKVYDGYLRKVSSTPIGGMLRRVGF